MCEQNVLIYEQLCAHQTSWLGWAVTHMSALGAQGPFRTLTQTHLTQEDKVRRKVQQKGVSDEDWWEGMSAGKCVRAETSVWAHQQMGVGHERTCPWG